MHDVEAERTPRNGNSLDPVMVREGETVTLDFHVAAPAEVPKALNVTTDERPQTRPRRPAPSTRDRIAREQQPIRKRPETAVGKLLNQLDELRPKGGQDEWATVLRELVELGPAAVPELIAEMDSTNNEYMLRCLGFVMRGIGDKRAVPALIRALPKTCVTARSDMGYIAKDPGLLAFMQKHDIDDRDEHKDQYYSFGRAINEFRVTLPKLTGASHGEDEIVHVFLEGSPHQQFLQRSLYQRCAERWAAWWEKNWKEHVADESYAKVNLPPLTEKPPTPLRFPHGADITVDSHGNHLLESVRNPKAETVFHDFDTGRIAALPEHLRAAANLPERLDDILAWAAHEGFDLMGTEYTPPGSDKPHYVLSGLGLTAWHVETARWQSLDEELQADESPALGRRSGGLLARFDAAKGQYVPEETATFFFQTREGGHGAIFVGVEVHDDNLKPGGLTSVDDELRPIAFHKGRRFAYKMIAQHTAQDDAKGSKSR
jgi:hypothetical protein